MHLGFFFSCLFCFIKKLICIPTDGFKISFFANVFPLFLHTDCLTACNQTQSNSNKGTINRVHLPVSEILFLAYCFNLYILLRRYLGECKTETLLSQIMQWKLQSSSINELISKSLIMLGILDVMVCVCFCNLKRFSLGYSMWRRKLKMLPHRSKHGSFFWNQLKIDLLKSYTLFLCICCFWWQKSRRSALHSLASIDTFSQSSWSINSALADDQNPSPSAPPASWKWVLVNGTNVFFKATWELGS